MYLVIRKVQYIDNLQFYCHFNSILAISGQREGDYERPCAMESSLQLERFLPTAGIKTGSARSARQSLTQGAPKYNI